MTKEQFKKKYPQARAHKGRSGWAIYTRPCGARVTNWHSSRSKAWSQIQNHGPNFNS